MSRSRLLLPSTTVPEPYIRENMLKCIERECNLARPKVDWRMHRYYVELKKGIREELYP